MAKHVIEDKRLMAEWDWEKNNECGLNPHHLTMGSRAKAWWRCKKRHSYSMPIMRRAYNHSGCPYCANQIIKEGVNDLATLRPDLAKEWHPTKNGDLKPSEIGAGTPRKVWWLCPKGHSYESQVKERVTRNRGCPYCAGQKPEVGVNDLLTKCPLIASEWHPTKNGELKPTDVMPKTNKKVWWLCPYGHEYQASPAKRTIGEGCPICQKFNRTSMPEYIIFHYMKSAYQDAINSYKPDFLGTSELDIFLPSKKVGIEFDGVWHKVSRDIGKDRACSSNGILLIRVRSNKAKSYERTDPTFVWDQTDYDKLTEIINQIFTILGADLDNSFVDVKRDFDSIFAEYHKTHIANNLKEKYPNLAQEWHPTKNGSLKPENIPATLSKNKYWWKCSVCGHEWEAGLNNRINGRGCPKCKFAKISNLKKKPVVQLTMDGQFVRTYESVSDAINATGFTGIYRAVKGKAKSSGGYIWQYEET